MTTHDRDKIIAAASSAGIQLIWDRKFGREDYQSILGSFPSLERLYAIAYEAGRVAEREECAVIADNQPVANSIAKAIRARSTK